MISCRSNLSIIRRWPYTSLYIFVDNRAHRVEISALKKRANTQSKTLSQMEKNCKALWSRVDLIIEKVNIMGKK